MGDISEHRGEAVAVGGTVYPREPATIGRDGHTQERSCLNCGTVLVGPHCHACGQAAHIHRTLAAFLHDLLHGVLHFEGKVFRTLPLLAWRPGRLTREYIDGRRASYVSPIALFLFTVFISFAAFNALGGTYALGEGVIVQADPGVEAAYRASGKQVERLQAQLRRNDLSPARRAEIETDIADLIEQRATLGTLLDLAGSERDAMQDRLPETTSTNPVLSAWERAKGNPQLLIYKLQTNAYKFSWLLIPLSVPFVWLLFAWRRDFAIYDHTVFVTYSITFMIALVGVVSLLAYVGLGWAGTLLLYAPFHLYRQLRGTYALGRLSAAWRMLALGAFIWLAIALFALILLELAGGLEG